MTKSRASRKLFGGISRTPRISVPSFYTTAFASPQAPFLSTLSEMTVTEVAESFLNCGGSVS